MNALVVAWLSSRPNGRPATWGCTRRPVRRSPRRTGRPARRHWSGAASFWVRAKVTGRPISADSRHIQSTSFGGLRRSSPAAPAGASSNTAGAEVAEHATDAEQLVLGGEGAGHRLAVDGPVGDGAAGREPERAGLDALADDVGHRRDVLGSGRLVLGPALAHHVGPDRAVGRPGCRRRPTARACPGGRGTRGSSPTPRSMPSDSAAPGMSSTPSISPISQSCRSGAAGANPTPQLPMTSVVTPCQVDGAQHRVPGDLAVVVGVDVDDAGHDEHARRRRSPRRPGPRFHPRPR